MNIPEIIKRLKIALGIKTDKELAEKIGITQNTLSSWKKRQEILITKILNIIPTNESLDWIINGIPKNDFLISEQTFEKISVKSFLEIISQNKIPPIILIPEKAKAGYLSENNQEEQELEIMIHPKYKNGNEFRYFEISGDSMENTLFDKDIVFCEKKELQEIKQGKIYVFYTNNGFICKRLYEVLNPENEIINLHSDNSKYDITKLEKNTIISVWEIKEINRKIK